MSFFLSGCWAYARVVFSGRSSWDRAAFARPIGRLLYGGGRIVVGDSHHVHAGRGGAVYELSRRAATVGGGGVEVEVDGHRADARCEAEEPCRGTALRLRPWRLTSARYSRTSRSR